MPLHIKVEINCKEHFSILPLVKVPFKVENMWYKGEAELLSSFNMPIVQRLGYILEHVLEEEQAAEELFALLKASGRPFRKVVLKAAKGETEYVENRWKIIDNQPIEIDEL